MAGLSQTLALVVPDACAPARGARAQGGAVEGGARFLPPQTAPLRRAGNPLSVLGSVHVIRPYSKIPLYFNPRFCFMYIIKIYLDIYIFF